MQPREFHDLAWDRLFGILHALRQGVTIGEYIDLAHAPPPAAQPPPSMCGQQALFFAPRDWIASEEGRLAFKPCYGPTFYFVPPNQVVIGKKAYNLHEAMAQLGNARLICPHPYDVHEISLWLKLDLNADFPSGFWAQALAQPNGLIAMCRAFQSLGPRDLRRWRVSSFDYALFERYGPAFPEKQAERLWKKLYHNNQYAGNCPLADLELERAIAFRRGKHGLAIKRILRDVHLSDLGRLCPISTAEGENVGRLVALAESARLTPLGYIAAAHEDDPSSFYHPPFSDLPAHCTYRDMFCRTANRLPFVIYDDPTRALMAANMARQALRIGRSAPSLVCCTAPQDPQFDAALAQVRTTAMVAYLAIPGATFEDGFLVSEGFARSPRACVLKTYRYALVTPKVNAELESLEVGDAVHPNRVYELIGAQGKLTFLHRGSAGWLSAIDPSEEEPTCEIACMMEARMGDKLCGGHGNKGVIVRIEPDPSMPCLPNGHVIDICTSTLSPLARLNLGQLFEAHLGLAGYVLGRTYLIDHDRPEHRPAVYAELAEAWRCWMGAHPELASQTYHPALRELIHRVSWEEVAPYAPQSLREEQKARKLENAEAMARIVASCRAYAAFLNVPCPEEASLEGWVAWARMAEALVGWPSPIGGKMLVRDGSGGEFFDAPLVVGPVSVMRLNHLAIDKLSMRATGPYSVAHMQPLRGRKHKGGQRLGEMEVWSYLAHGATQNLSEVISFRSDYTASPSQAYVQLVERGDLDPPKAYRFEQLRAILESIGITVDLQ